MYKCPYPGCDYVSPYGVFNSHAQQHGYEKVVDLVKEHGHIVFLYHNPRKFAENRKMNNNITEGSYNNVDTAIARARMSDRSQIKNRD